MLKKKAEAAQLITDLFDSDQHFSFASRKEIFN